MKMRSHGQQLMTFTPHRSLTRQTDASIIAEAREQTNRISHTLQHSGVLIFYCGRRKTLYLDWPLLKSCHSELSERRLYMCAWSSSRVALNSPKPRPLVGLIRLHRHPRRSTSPSSIPLSLLTHPRDLLHHSPSCVCAHVYVVEGSCTRRWGERGGAAAVITPQSCRRTKAFFIHPLLDMLKVQVQDGMWPFRSGRFPLCLAFSTVSVTFWERRGVFKSRWCPGRVSRGDCERSRLSGLREDGKLWWESGPALSALHWRAP